jgi:hypothetical protein
VKAELRRLAKIDKLSKLEELERKLAAKQGTKGTQSEVV